MLTVTGKGLTIENIESVARRGEQVALHADAIQRIHTCRGFIEERIEDHEVMYGVNTGIGEFSEVVLDDEQVKQFQREIKSQESSMEKLKRISANPVALANKNKSLEDQLSKITSTNKLLAEENEHLKDASAKDWFILGASVSLGSLLFGLLITRINWKRKRHSWGDF